MCLWDEVLAWDTQTIAARADSHRDLAHPLRSRDQLRAVHLCEYGAQAMAIHGGLLAKAAGGRCRPGMLVALRAVDLHVIRINDLPGQLTCTATVLTSGENSWQYAFTITHEAQLLAEGRAAVVLHDPA